MAARRYRTIVADPPWHYERTGFSFGEKHSGGGRRGRPTGTTTPYASLTVAEIAALPVADLAEADAHLYLWTTNRYIFDAKAIAEAWGFSAPKVLTWCKAPTGFAMGGAYGSASEFILFCRRGALKPLERVPRDWWQWPRSAHSAKPEAFLDMVEQVSPGPRLEMFARRDRLGWDTWGNESLGTAAMPEAASA